MQLADSFFGHLELSADLATGQFRLLSFAPAYFQGRLERESSGGHYVGGNENIVGEVATFRHMQTPPTCLSAS